MFPSVCAFSRQKDKKKSTTYFFLCHSGLLFLSTSAVDSFHFFCSQNARSYTHLLFFLIALKKMNANETEKKRTVDCLLSETGEQRVVLRKVNHDVFRRTHLSPTRRTEPSRGFAEVSIPMYCSICNNPAMDAMFPKCCTNFVCCRPCTMNLFEQPSVQSVPCQCCETEIELSDFAPDYRAAQMAAALRKCPLCSFTGFSDDIQTHLENLSCDGVRRLCWQSITVESLDQMTLPTEEVLLQPGVVHCLVRAMGAPILAKMSTRVRLSLNKQFFESFCSVPSLLAFAHIALQNDRGLVEFIVKNGQQPSVLRFASDSLRQDIDFARHIVKNVDWRCFRYFSHHVQDTDDIVVLAMDRSEGKVFQFISARMQMQFCNDAEGYGLDMVINKAEQESIVSQSMVDMWELMDIVPNMLRGSGSLSTNVVFQQFMTISSCRFLWRYIYWYVTVLHGSTPSPQNEIAFEFARSLIDDSKEFSDLADEFFQGDSAVQSPDETVPGRRPSPVSTPFTPEERHTTPEQPTQPATPISSRRLLTTPPTRICTSETSPPLSGDKLTRVAGIHAEFHYLHRTNTQLLM